MGLRERGLSRSLSYLLSAYTHFVSPARRIPRGVVSIGDVGDEFRGLLGLLPGPGVDVVQRLLEVAEIESRDGHVVPTKGLFGVTLAGWGK